MFENNEVYVIEKFDTIKNCFVFWNVVETYKKAKDAIYKSVLEEVVSDDRRINLSDGGINEYDYFTATISGDLPDDKPLVYEFRGHPVVIGMTNNFYMDRYVRDNKEV